MAPATTHRPPLAAGEVNLFMVGLDVGDERAGELRSHLSAGERERAERLLPPGAGRRFAIARGRLRELLGAALDVAPAAVRFRVEAGGKPALAASHERVIRLSLSHSGDRALVAIASGVDVGVDIERERDGRDLERLARRVMPPVELGRWRAIDEPAARGSAFYAGWVRKEAYLKALGTGLRVAPAAAVPPPGWTVRDVPVEPGYRAAVAWAGAARLSLRDGFAGVGAGAAG